MSNDYKMTTKRAFKNYENCSALAAEPQLLLNFKN